MKNLLSNYSESHNFILDEIINKLKKEDLDKLEKFKKNIFDFFK